MEWQGLEEDHQENRMIQGKKMKVRVMMNKRRMKRFGEKMDTFQEGRFHIVLEHPWHDV